ncbi:LacI family DNA-binding transcriptional regulator [Nonomuraea aridisoli]|uniref:LacI family transcriptional regulator n=1 Tax=Nonomuraea aridisoli TaxID=2070368 RepID=A0A2W2F6Z1_9ACTN|nr:LacI family DNA-binding transcriptional regulator [Nonomuraea aridisoli]PZG21390.1 LacI family transcriptional regulator [Nonomuraea aridisoli]
MTEQPTLAQVAAAAGVSPATASRVLTGSVRVSTSTRRQVYDAVSRMGYVRHRAPRGTSAGTMTDGVTAVVCDHLPRLFSEPYYARLLSAAGNVIAEHGTHLMVTTVSPASATLPALSGSVLIVGARERHPLAIKLSTSGMPVRGIGRPPHDLKLPFADVDNRDGGRQAAEHFLLTGRRTIAAIGGPPSLPGARDRLEGLVRTLQAAGLPDVPVAYGDFTAASGVHAMQWLLRHAPGVDAVFAASDLMAAGAIQALRRAGRKVPTDVAVIGFDDAPVARQTVPTLTTVRQPVEELATVATRLLLTGAGGVDPVLPTELVVRESA